MKRKKSQLMLPMLLFAAVILLTITALTIANSMRRSEIEDPGPYSHPDEIPRVTAEEAYLAVTRGEAVLLDTRSETEFQARRAAGAINIPINEFEARVGELDPETWYISYCT
jgi:predicted sulfurtransferase